MASLIVQLVAFSVIPLLGVAFWGWDWRQIIVFYWFSNISQGIFTFIDILRSAPQKPHVASSGMSILLPSGAQSIPPDQAHMMKKILMLVFFPIHYGMFTLVHGFFVFMLVSGNLMAIKDDVPVDVAAIAGSWLIGMVVALTVRLLYSNRQQMSPEMIMMNAYRRIAVLHVVIIGGAFLIQVFGLPPLVAVGLIILNAGSELSYFYKDRKNKSVSAVAG